MNKQANREMVRERARAAIRDLYHNATVYYPCLEDSEARYFEGWFQDAATFELEYIQDGGAYGSNYRECLVGNAKSKFTSQGARDYYVKKGLRDMREEREKYARWEGISKYGKLYTYGRGGRTLAPDRLATGGCYWKLKEDYFDDVTYADTVEAILVIEAFNRMVSNWCHSVPDLWKEEVENRMQSYQETYPNENFHACA